VIAKMLITRKAVQCIQSSMHVHVYKNKTVQGYVREMAGKMFVAFLFRVSLFSTYECDQLALLKVDEMARQWCYILYATLSLRVCQTNETVCREILVTIRV